MSRKAIIPLVLGLGIGLLAVKFVVESIQKAQASSAARQVVTIVRAKQDIAAHEEIGKELVETVETADNLLAPSNERIEKLETAIGRVTAKPIPRGMPVLLSMLSPEGTKPGMVGRIPPGFRAVSVKIDEVAAAGYQIQPGDWVDVIVVMDIDTGNRGKKETIAEVILQHVQVAAIGHGTNPEQETTGTKVKPAKSATLLVPEEEVPKLHLAGTRGKLTLAMRGEDDETIEDPRKAIGSQVLDKLTKMLDTPPEPAPAPAPAPVISSRMTSEPEPEPYPVLVMRHSTIGNQATVVEQITFEGPQSAKVISVGKGAPSRAAATLGAVKTGRSQPVPPAGSGPAPVQPTPPAEDGDGAEDGE